ncbi:MAG TPA: hypothetical protein VEJ45_09975 [Candidatus Acidoferrales bacterium]|nr:hypothetical protein [Candidatus Acidoferrales bacterium]
MMLNIRVRGWLAALAAAALCGAAWPPRAVPDDGKSLVFAPAPVAPASPGECDRECLYGFVDKYFDAMLSRYPSTIALAPDVKYTENEQIVKPGEGIWKTFSGRGTYRVYLADPTTGEAGYYGDIREDGGLLVGMVALRIKVKEHRIAEIELITVREEKRPRAGLGLSTAGIMTPRMMDELDGSQFIRPNPALVEPVQSPANREHLVGATRGYFDAFQQSQGSLAPIDSECYRRENGVTTTNNPDGPVIDRAQPAFRLFSGSCAEEIDRRFFSALWKVRGLRPLVIDEKQGLVLNLAFFDNEGDAPSVAVPEVGSVAVPVELRRPITFMTPQLFKIENGKIRAIEGISWPVPFGMHSAWGD